MQDFVEYKNFIYEVLSSSKIKSNRNFALGNLHPSEYEVLVATRYKTWVCGRSLSEIAGSNPAGDMDVCLLLMCVCYQVKSLRRADHLSKGVLLSVLCLSVIVYPR
jgi:hypothetical protein